MEDIHEHSDSEEFELHLEEHPDASEEQEGYLFEPEYSLAEVLNRREQRDVERLEQGAALDDAIQAAIVARPRRNSNWWCSCKFCPSQEREIDSICCREWMLADYRLREVEVQLDEGETPCLTLHQQFDGHLQSGVLETFFLVQDRVNWKRQRRPLGPDGKLTNKQVSRG